MSDASERGERARQLLDDPLLVEAFDKLEKHAVDLLATTSFENTNELISATSLLRAARDVRQMLTSLVTTGNLEERKRPAVA